MDENGGKVYASSVFSRSCATAPSMVGSSRRGSPRSMSTTPSMGASSTMSQSSSDWMWYLGGGTQIWTQALVVTIGMFIRPSACPAVRPDFEWTRLRIASMNRSTIGSPSSFTADIVCELSVIGLA